MGTVPTTIPVGTYTYCLFMVVLYMMNCLPSLQIATEGLRLDISPGISPHMAKLIRQVTYYKYIPVNMYMYHVPTVFCSIFTIYLVQKRIGGSSIFTQRFEFKQTSAVDPDFFSFSDPVSTFRLILDPLNYFQGSVYSHGSFLCF